MRWSGIGILAAIVFASVSPARTRSPLIQTEILKLEAAATDPDLKMVLAGAMAEDLRVHRNHIFRLRRETGQSYGEIYVSWLESQGHSEAAILEKLGRLKRTVSGSGPERQGSGPRPVAYLNALGGQSSSGSFYALVPEVGFVSRRAAWVVGLPYYRFSGAPSAAGIGDLYSTASLFGSVRGFDFTPAVTIGFATGDRSRALGAGKTTVDVSVAIAKRIKLFQPFVRLGFANSIFNNVGYQRSYIADGKAAYLTTGLDARPLRRLTVGAAGFAMWPFGPQFLYSRSAADVSTPLAPPGHMRPAAGMNPASVVSATPGGELRERGLSVWASFRIAPALSFNTAASRSISYHVTTVRAGIGVDLLACFRSVGNMVARSRHAQP